MATRTDTTTITATATNAQKTGKHDLKIIGLGFQRCGSFSLKYALDELGFKCFHPIQMLDNMVKTRSISVRHNLEWKWWYNFDSRASEACESKTNVDFDDYFSFLDAASTPEDPKHYDTLLDWPFCFYYKQLCEYYPNAKCILCVRKKKERWLASFMALYKIMLKRKLFWFFGLIYERTLWLDQFGLKCLNTFGVEKYEQLVDDKFDHEKVLLERYDERQREMIKFFEDRGESDRLLVFNLIDDEACQSDADKWKVLCKFLGVSMPIEKDGKVKKFPHKNQKQFLQSAFRQLAWLAAGPVIVVSVLVVLLAVVAKYSM